jgi:hypothetical protein
VGRSRNEALTMKILSWIALALLASLPLIAQDDFWD